jgi:hypothetical protein
VSLTEEPPATRRDRASAREWVRRSPQDWRAHARLGEIEFERGKARAARAAYVQAWRLNPDEPGVRTQLTMLDAMLGGRQRRSALVEVERLIAQRDLPAEVLPVIVDVTVALRVRWLVLAATVGVYGYGALVLTHWEDGSVAASTWPRAAVGCVLVLALLALWLGPLLARLTPATRRLLPGLLRRDPLLGLEIALQLVAVGLLVAVPFLWAAGLSTAVGRVTLAAFALTVLGGAIVAGISLVTGGGGWSLVGLVLLPPLTLPLAIAAAIVTALFRVVIRIVRAISKPRAA